MIEHRRIDEFGETRAVVTRLFQIWIAPLHQGDAAAWSTRAFPKEGRTGQSVLLVGRSGQEDSLPIRADAELVLVVSKELVRL